MSSFDRFRREEAYARADHQGRHMNQPNTLLASQINDLLRDLYARIDAEGREIAPGAHLQLIADPETNAYRFTVDTVEREPEYVIVPCRECQAAFTLESGYTALRLSYGTLDDGTQTTTAHTMQCEQP